MRSSARNNKVPDTNLRFCTKLTQIETHTHTVGHTIYNITFNIVMGLVSKKYKSCFIQH